MVTHNCLPFTRTLLTDWVGIPKEDGLQDGITKTEIAQFREGFYKDANPNIQRKWCHVMLHFLPCVCSNYNKWEIKINTPLSQVTSASDEALVLWFLKCYIDDWDKLYEDRRQEQDLVRTNKRRRKEGKHKSNEELGEFLDLHASIIQARQEKGKGWDEALMEMARLQDKSINNTTVQDRMQEAPSANQAAKRTYAMLLSDEEDDSPSLVGNATNKTSV